MSDLNDVIINLGGVERINGSLPVSASDAEIALHLSTNCIGGNIPTLAQVKARIAPYLAEIASALAAQSAKESLDNAAITTAKANNVIQFLVNNTPAECIAKVNSDVTDLASAKVMLGHFAVALSILAKDKLRE